MSEITNDDDTDASPRTDQTLACIRGHQEARERLEAVGFSPEAVNTVEDRSDGFVEFARIVADAVSWSRDHPGGDDEVD
ncbi:hypothetical protein [Halorubrum ezzemoulense]|uniref:Uncharacterized protein n=1 Tax=Halorubrum ezzemoulense TaxID=337243 RepID=A0A256JS48_HALEZ|nr:hypothetical protein [Halorubrum ezzemoulense]OYR71580.1 hypothetical protein DJ78_05035 [Halorubrum ezzemoulense]